MEINIKCKPREIASYMDMLNGKTFCSADDVADIIAAVDPVTRRRVREYKEDINTLRDVVKEKFGIELSCIEFKE